MELEAEDLKKIVPAWFWRVVALCGVSALGIVGTAGWSLGAFMSETQMWIKHSDERFLRHLEVENSSSERIAKTLETLVETTNNNGKYGAAFKEKMASIEKRLDKEEAETERQRHNGRPRHQ